MVHGRLTFGPAEGASDLSLAPSTLLASGALDHVRIGVFSTTTPVIDQVIEKIGFVGDELGHVTHFPLYPPPPYPRSAARTEALFESQYLKRPYRLGARTDLVIEVRLNEDAGIRIALRESVLQRTGVTFDGLPDAFRNDIRAEVRGELERAKIPVPAFLREGRANDP